MVHHVSEMDGVDSTCGHMYMSSSEREIQCLQTHSLLQFVDLLSLLGKVRVRTGMEIASLFFRAKDGHEHEKL